MELYSYLLKQRCPYCTGNIECKTESAGEFAGSIVDIQTWVCMMCARDIKAPVLISHTTGQVVAIYKTVQDRTDDDFSVWEHTVKVNLCHLKKRK